MSGAVMRSMAGGLAGGAVLGAAVLFAASLSLPLPDRPGAMMARAVPGAEPPPAVVAEAPPAVPDPVAGSGSAPAAEPAPLTEDGPGGSDMAAAPSSAEDSAGIGPVPSAETPAETPADTPAAAARPETGIVATPYGSEFARGRDDLAPRLPGLEPAPSTGAASGAPAVPLAEREAPVPPAPGPAPMPEARAAAPEAPAEPDAPADAPAAPAADTEVAALGSAAAPQALDRPEAEDGALPAAEPAPAPPAPAPPAAPAPDAEAAPAPEEPAAEATAPAQPDMPEAPPQAPPAPASEAPALPGTGTALPALPPALPPAAEPGPAPVPPVVQSIAPLEPAAPVILRPGTQPSPGFSGAAGVRINRPGSAEPAPATAPDLQEQEPSDPLPALVAHAAPFMAPPGAPLLAVLLMQSADSPVIPAELLADLPFPVTIAIDPTLPDAAATAELYRAAGQEVAILAALPPGAQPQDIETAWQEYRRLLPEAVAVVDLPDAAVQNDRVLATQLVELTSAAGQGLLIWNRGLAPAAQLADAAGVPEARIYRDLDAGGESAPVIGRYLDRAAFEASRTGAVVVAGSTRSETLAALLDWALAQSRAVTLAPVSAVLMRDM